MDAQLSQINNNQIISNEAVNGHLRLQNISFLAVSVLVEAFDTGSGVPVMALGYSIYTRYLYSHKICRIFAWTKPAWAQRKNWDPTVAEMPRAVILDQNLALVTPTVTVQSSKKT